MTEQPAYDSRFLTLFESLATTRVQDDAVLHIPLIPTSFSSVFVSGSMVTFDHKCSNIEDSEKDPRPI